MGYKRKSDLGQLYCDRDFRYHEGEWEIRMVVDCWGLGSVSDMCFSYSLLSLWSVRLLNREIYLLACPWQERVKQTRVLFLHLPPFLLEPIAIALFWLSFFVAFLRACLKIVVGLKCCLLQSGYFWKYFKPKGELFYMEIYCKTEQLTCFLFPQTGSHGILQVRV